MLALTITTLREEAARFSTAESGILLNVPKQGFLTLSTVLQWRLHYSRAIERAGMEEGVTNLYTARDC